MRTLETIQRLLKIKSSCSLAEVASISEQKKSKVLEEITENIALLRLNKQGNIVGFVDVRQKQIAKGLKNGKYYNTSLINYGYQSVINWNNHKAELLKTKYLCGGLGDSYCVNVILDTHENRHKIESEGAVCVDNIGKLHDIEWYWGYPNRIITL